MQILEFLSNFYNKLENKWFDLLDFLDSKGIPVYAYASFLEERGIPSFPFTIAIFLLIAVLIFSFVLISPVTSIKITLQVTDDLGSQLTNVQLTVSDSSGKIIFNRPVSSGETITLDNIKIGQTLTFEAVKQNYESARQQLIVEKSELPLSIQLTRSFEIIDAYVLLADIETDAIIRNATVLVDFGDQTITGKIQGDGRFLLSGIRANVEGQLIVKADGFEELRETTSFERNETKKIQLEPSNIALQGKTTLLITAIDSETQQIVKDVNITIINDSTEEIITQTNDEDGVYSEKIDLGTTINITVEKEGYMKFELSGLKLREEEVSVSALLEKGGKQLLVNVVTEKLPVNAATVQLFDSFNSLLDSKETGFGGAVVFTNLNQDNSYILTAFKNGFLPARLMLESIKEKEVTLNLEKETTLNVSKLKLNVLDDEGKPASNTTIKFYEIVNDNELPLGIPALQTDALGFIEVKLPVGKEIKIKAIKDLKEGSLDLKTEQGKDLEQTIMLELMPNVIKLLLKDFEGKTVNGNILITSASGEILFDGNTENGVIYFNSKGNSEATAKVTLNDGTTISEKINLKDKTQLTLTVLTAETDITPVIEFVSVLDEKGEKVTEIARGKFYWLEFMTTWPKGNYIAGVHIRVGDDSIQFADSDSIGILGFQANADDFTYGQSYTFKSKPGNESLDRYNKGKANEFNKWLELYFKKHNDTEIIKVKVKAKENSSIKEFSVKYRAWTEFQGRFFREPYDAVLGLEKFSLEKSALYAETKEEKIKIAEDTPKCTKDFCFDYAFFEPTGLKVEEKDFNPLVEKVYALELRITAMKELKANILFETNKESPNLYFTALQIDSFSGFPDSASQEVEKTIESLTIAANSERKLRIYFKGIKEENSFIRFTINAGTQKEEKTLYFNLSKEHEMKLEVAPQTVNINETFVVRLTDLQTTEFITNAKITILDQFNKTVRAVQGNNTRNKGLNGEYLFQANLDYGFYKIEAQAKGFKKAEGAIAITKEGLLELSKISIDLKKGEKSKTGIIVLTNKSKFIIKDLTFEFKKMPGSSNDFIFKAALPEMINAAQTININVTAEYQGDAEERAHSEVTLIVRGRIEALFPVETKQLITANYNQPLPESCISFDKDEIKLDLYAEANAKESVPLKIRNNCAETITLSPEFKTEKKDSELSLETQPVTLKQDEEKEVTIDVTNKIQRMYYAPVTQKHYIYWIAPQLTRSIPIIINLRSLYFSLQTNDNITIYAAPEEKTNVIRGFAPLYIRNAGFKPIEGLTFSVKAPQGIELSIIPNEQGFYSNNMPSNMLTPAYTDIYNNNLYQNPSYFNASFAYTSLQQPFSPYVMPQYLPTTINELPYNPYLTPTAFTPFNEMIGLQQSLYSKALMPGQELLPVKSVIAIIRNPKSLGQGPFIGQILISGTIDGKRYYLKQVNVWINVSGTECLKLFTLESTNFESSELNEMQIARKVQLRNDCSETLRGFTIEPNEIGGNKLELEQEIPLAPQQSITTRIVLTKSNSYNSRDAGEKIVVIGQTTATLRKIKSNPITIKISLGEKAKETGRKTTAIEVPVCEEPNINEKVSFPLKAKDDCSQGYCDAVQASKDIAKTIKEIFELAVRRSKEGSNSSTAFGCLETQQYCPYSVLGVPTIKKELYLMNDFISINLLKNELKNLNSEVKDYAVDIRPIEIADISTAFIARQILLSNPINGCGKYELEFDGAMKNATGKLINEEQTIIIKVKKIEGTTEECKLEIQNLLNFLPEDKGLSADTTQAEPGTIFYQPQKKEVEAYYQTLAEKFSEAFFGTKERIHQKQTNSIELISEDLKDRILEITIEGKKSTNELSKVEIKAKINKQYFETKSETSEAIKNEIIQAIKSIAEAHKDREMCITKDKKTVKLRTLGSMLGKMILSGDNKIDIQGGKSKACNDLKIESRIPGSIELNAKIKDATNNEIEIPSIKISFEPKEKFELKENKITLKSAEKGHYVGEFKLCIELQETAFESSIKPTSETQVKEMPIESLLYSKIEVTAKHSTTENYEAEPLIIEPVLCSIHPEKLQKEMIDLEEGKHYLTFEWKNEPTEIPIEAFRLNYQQIHAEKTAAGTLAAEEKKKAEKISAMIWRNYLATCAAVDIGGNIALTAFTGPLSLTNAIINPLLDCVLPAASGIAAVYQTSPLNIINSILKIIPDLITKFTKKVFTLGETETKEKEIDEVIANISDTAAIDLTAKSIARAVVMRDTLTKYALLSGGAKRIADDMARQVTERSFAQMLGIKLSESKGGKTLEQLIIEGGTPIKDKLKNELLDAYNNAYKNAADRGLYQIKQQLKGGIFRYARVKLPSTEITNAMLKEMTAPKVIEKLGEGRKELISKLEDTSLKNTLQETEEKVIKESTEELKKSLVEGRGDKIIFSNDGTLPGQFRSKVTELKKDIIERIKSKIPLSPKQETEIKKKLTDLIKGKIIQQNSDPTIKIRRIGGGVQEFTILKYEFNEKQFVESVAESLAKNPALKEAIATGSENKIAQATANVLKESLPAKVSQLPAEQAVTKVAGRTFRVIKNFGFPVAIGIAANALGMKSFLNARKKMLEEQNGSDNAITIAKPSKTEGEDNLKKYWSYILEIKEKKNSINRTFTFSKVTNFDETMQGIADKKIINLNDKECKRQGELSEEFKKIIEGIESK